MAANNTNSHGNIYLAFKESARVNAERVALKGEGGKGRQYTYAEMHREVTNLAHGLGEDSPDDCREIGLLSENRPEWAIAYLAILASGRTVVPIDANLKPNEIGHIIDHSGLKTILTSQRFETILAGLSSSVRVYSFAEESPQSWRRLFRSEGRTRPDKLDSVAALIYTSGTTGSPKAVILTHRCLLSNVDGARDAFKLYPDDIFLSVLPLHHTFESTGGFLLPIMCGCSIVYARSLKSRELLQDMKSNGVTVMLAVPLLYEKMYHALRRRIKDAPTVRRAMFSLLLGASALSQKIGLPIGRTVFASVRERAGLDSLRLLASGAAALPMEIIRFFNLIGLSLVQGYGLTECSPIVTLNREDDNVFGSVGPALSNVEVRIDQPNESGIGEILVRGPAITGGYKDNPEETARLLQDGWLYTGDLGVLRGDHLWITGRQKNVIVSAAGKNIYPEELEEHLALSLFVMEVIVLGRCKEGKQGEEVRALIVPDLQQFQADFNMSADKPDMDVVREQIGEVVAEVNRHVADYKRIVGFEVQIEELEKTSTKKIKRFLYK